MFKNRVDGLLVSLAYDTDDVSHFEPFFKKNILGQPVGAAEQAARHQRLDPGGPWVAGVRTGVAGDVGAQRQQAAVPAETRLHQVAVVTGVAGGQQVLAAVLDPLDRRARQRPRHPAQRHVLGIEPGLDAEPAAHVGFISGALMGLVLALCAGAAAPESILSRTARS